MEIRRVQSPLFTFEKKMVFALFGWCATIICPILLLYFLPNPFFSWGNSGFIVTFTAALIMWVFRLVPESVPAMIVITFTMLIDSNQYKTILSGFTSDCFIVTLSLFVIGFVLTQSSFFYRCSVVILYYLPPKYSILQKVLFGMGVMLTPVIGAQSARVALIAPLLDDILISSQIGAGSSMANGLASAAFNGCILLSTIFLTGKSGNYILHSMLTAQNQEQFSWFQWLIAASFPGILLILSFFLMQSAYFKQKKELKINKFRLKKELMVLGKFSFEERAGLMGLTALLFGLLLSNIFRFSILWACLPMFFVVFASGSLTKNEFKKGINWSFLFYLGAIIGIMRYIQNLGLDVYLMHYLHWFTDLTDGNIELFIFGIYGMSWFFGLFLGTMTAPILLFTLFLPLSEHAGVNSWLLAFVILIATESWVFPYQSTYYLCFQELLNKKKNFELQSLLRLNAWWVLLKLCILFASFPFWRWLKII